MQSFLRVGATASLAAFALTYAAGTSLAQTAGPGLRLVPPTNNGFLVNQRFDIRGEATLTSGRTLTAISLTIDGTPVPSTAERLFTNANSITLRRFEFTSVGNHTITLNATDSAGGTSTLTQNYTVINPFGNRRPAKNLIILLGDGFGAGHKTAARLVKFPTVEGRTQGRLALDVMPNIATVLTHSLNSIVTDSAPGMASYVNGAKQNNNQEGVFPDNTANDSIALPGEPDANGNPTTQPTRTGAFDNPRIEYLGEYMARTRGKSLGIVSTADIEDATPAANMIHTADRGAGTGICDQYFDERANSNLRVLLGGGRRWFVPAGQVGSARSNGTDYQLDAATATALGVAPGALDPTRNLEGDFQAAGYAFATTRANLATLTANSNTTSLLGLFAYGNMNVAIDKINGRRGVRPVINGATRSTTVVQDFLLPDQPMLDEMTQSALTVLNRNNPNGFVLMVEAAHIDKQSHAMDAERAIYDTLEFDNAIRRAVEFANADGNTLVIVTADHECSGFSIIGGINTANALAAASDSGTLAPGTQPLRQRANVIGTYEGAGFPNYGPMASADSTTVADPIFGYPLSPDPARKLAIGYGGSGDRFEDWITEPVPFNDNIATTAIAAGNLTNPPYERNVTLRQPESQRGMFLRGQATGSGGQAVHLANEIPLYSLSTGTRTSSLFFGLVDNTDVFFTLARALGGNY